MLSRHRDYTVVLGTKPTDPEMDNYIAEGYKRIEEWPPPRKLVKDQYRDTGKVKLILWPKIKTRMDLYRFRPQYVKFLEDIFVDGNWEVVADEGLWLSDKKKLNLGDQLEAIAYAARTAGARIDKRSGERRGGVTEMLLIQRPAGVPRGTWANASNAFIFKMGITNDLRELAALSSYDPKAVFAAIKSLAPYEFLYLPTRAQSNWCISKVDLAQI